MHSLTSILSPLALALLASLAAAGPIEQRALSNPIVFQLGTFPFEKGTTINAYITGKDPNAGGQMGFVKKDGSWFAAPSSGQLSQSDIAIPVPTNNGGKYFNVTLPKYLDGGRVWFALNNTLTFKGAANNQLTGPSATAKNDPSINAFWGYTEFTYNAKGLDINPSAKDFVGLPNTFAVYNAAGKFRGLGNGTEVDAVTSVCKDLTTQAGKDGMPWDKLCFKNNKGQLVRVLDVTDYSLADFGNKQAFATYYDNYINQVWSKYSTETLTLGGGSCKVSNNNLVCNGGSVAGSHPKPTTAEIFGCSGSLLNNSPLCAGFTRSTLLTSNVSPSGPPSSFYQSDPTDYYSKITHNYEFGGIGYTFAYDDAYAPGDQNQSGNLNVPDAASVVHIIGGFGWGGYAPGQYA